MKRVARLLAYGGLVVSLLVAGAALVRADERTLLNASCGPMPDAACTSALILRGTPVAFRPER